MRFVDFGNTVVVSLHKLRRLFPRVSQYIASNRCWWLSSVSEAACHCPASHCKGKIGNLIFFGNHIFPSWRGGALDLLRRWNLSWETKRCGPFCSTEKFMCWAPCQSMLIFTHRWTWRWWEMKERWGFWWRTLSWTTGWWRRPSQKRRLMEDVILNNWIVDKA